MSDAQVETAADAALDRMDEGLGGTAESTGPVRERVDAAIDKTEGLVGRAFGEPAGRKVGEAARSAADSAEAAYARGFASLQGELARDPFRAVAIAAGAGLVLGLLLAGRNRTIIYRPTRA